jgi:hypothetical protein
VSRRLKSRLSEEAARRPWSAEPAIDGQHDGAGRTLRGAPKALLVVPIVGAFFIDFINAILITICRNVFA